MSKTQEQAETTRKAETVGNENEVEVEVVVGPKLVC